jgi:voltage-gated sodium channel
MTEYPYAWAFFVPFILLATFTMLNLFIGIIVDTMQTLHDDQIEADREIIERTIDRDTQGIEETLQALRAEVRALHETLRERG